jgi:hypothetical protein
MPWGKQWLSVEGLQVPLIVRGPQIAANQRRGASREPHRPRAVGFETRWIARARVDAGQAILSGEFSGVDSSSSPRGIAVAMPWTASAPSSRRDRWFVRHFHPEQSRLNWSSYKEDQYPGMPGCCVRSTHRADDGADSEGQTRRLPTHLERTPQEARAHGCRTPRLVDEELRAGLNGR